LCLEVAEPEYASLMRLQCSAYCLSLILVDNILEINLVQVIGPRVKYLEAFVTHILATVSLNIGFDEFET
jgi:hypothetical protein